MPTRIVAPAPTPHDDQPAKRSRWSVRQKIGVVVITLALILVGYMAYNLYSSNSVNNDLADDARNKLSKAWNNGDDMAKLSKASSDKASAATMGGRSSVDVPLGAFAVMTVPKYGNDWRYVMMTDVTQQALAAGPGHYPETANPGQRGNMATAGHRMGYGAPFTKLNTLDVCDEIIITTKDMQYTYAVLTMSNDDATREKEMSACVKDQGTVDEIVDGNYGHLVGRHITTPDDVDVLDPIPSNPASIPNSKGKADIDPALAMLTITTCHPWWSNRQRQIVEAVLVDAHSTHGADIL